MFFALKHLNFSSLSVTVLVLLAASAGAGVVSADGLLDTYRLCYLLFACVLTCRVVGVLLSAAGGIFVFLCTISAVVASALCLGTAYLLRLADRYLSSHKYCRNFAVDGLYHSLEEVETFEFVYQKRVFLFVACVLYRLA